MASSVLPTTTLPSISMAIRNRGTLPLDLSTSLSSRGNGFVFNGQRFYPKVQMEKAAKGLSHSHSHSHSIPRFLKTRISCSIAQPETLQIVQEIIAKQLSLDESAVIPDTKFADLGADSLDTVEIMMALEEKFEVSIGDGGAENISTVQDAADLIEKVKAANSN